MGSDKFGIKRKPPEAGYVPSEILEDFLELRSERLKCMT
jgi:hypothetical protein